MERGPFGKSTTRRATSRGRTTTPAATTKEEMARVENNKVIDEVFGKWKQDLEEKDKQGPREQKPAVSAMPAPLSKPAMDTASHSNVPAPLATGQHAFNEPTEVLIHGFGRDTQYAAIEYFENASQGRMYEDYDRYPPQPRYNTFLNTSRTGIPRSLPQAAIQKIKRYQGGNHWIKVTFDSPQAAERACWSSPHPIHGYLCHAEPWRGVAPSPDVAILERPGNQPGTSTVQHRRPYKQTAGFSTMPSRIHPTPQFGQPEGQLGNSWQTGASESPDSSFTASSGTVQASNDTQQGLQQSVGKHVVPIISASAQAITDCHS